MDIREYLELLPGKALRFRNIFILCLFKCIDVHKVLKFNKL